MAALVGHLAKLGLPVRGEQAACGSAPVDRRAYAVGRATWATREDRQPDQPRLRRRRGRLDGPLAPVPRRLRRPRLRPRRRLRTSRPQGRRPPSPGALDERCPGPDEAAALLGNKLHGGAPCRQVPAPSSPASNLPTAPENACRPFSFRLESDARRLVDRAVLATLTSHLRDDRRRLRPSPSSVVEVPDSSLNTSDKLWQAKAGGLSSRPRARGAWSSRGP